MVGASAVSLVPLVETDRNTTVNRDSNQLPTWLEEAPGTDDVGGGSKPSDRMLPPSMSGDEAEL